MNIFLARHYANFGKSPITMTCSNCGSYITTKTRSETGVFQYVIAGVLCFIGCCPCCLIPFCVSDWEDVVHSCPNCNIVVGRHKYKTWDKKIFSKATETLY